MAFQFGHLAYFVMIFGTFEDHAPLLEYVPPILEHARSSTGIRSSTRTCSMEYVPVLDLDQILEHAAAL